MYLIGRERSSIFVGNSLPLKMHRKLDLTTMLKLYLSIIATLILQWNLYCLYDTSNQGTIQLGKQNLVPEKRPRSLCIYNLPLLKWHLYAEERDTFSGSRDPGLRPPHRGHQFLQNANYLSITCMWGFHTQYCRDKSIMIFYTLSSCLKQWLQ